VQYTVGTATGVQVQPIDLTQNSSVAVQFLVSAYQGRLSISDLMLPYLYIVHTFLPCLALMVGFSVLATAAILKLLLRLVFVGCTLGVHYFTASQDLPKPYNLSNELAKARYV